MDILTQLRAERGKVTRPFKCRAPRFSPERLGPRLWKSHVESHLGGRSFPPTIGSGPYGNHDSFMRTSRRYGMRERPINTDGLACADQGQPRAALDANDLWILGLRAQYPVELYSLFSGHGHLSNQLGLLF